MAAYTHPPTESRDQGVDPITVEVLRNAFNAVADEMSANLVRSAYSPIIYDMKDCSVALFNERVELLGQAPGLPIFLAALDEAVRVVSAHVGLDGFEPGDVYIINDPYLTGSHLNDVTVISPVFYDGQVVGFAATKAHWMDMGGKDASVSIDTTEIYQEGLRLGPTRVVAGGKMVDDIVDILMRNSRLPKALFGDMSAQIAACRTGERHSLGAMDYFAYRNGDLFDAMLNFYVGVPFWDNWALSYAAQRVPVVDATLVVAAIHQEHERDARHGYEARSGHQEEWGDYKHNEDLFKEHAKYPRAHISDAEWTLDDEELYRRARGGPLL